MSLVLLGNGLTGLEGLPPGSVDLVLSDLPSGETQAEFDEPVNLKRFFLVSWQALKPNGAIVVMASSFRFAVEVFEAEPRFFRYDAIWSKSTAAGFLNSKRMPLRSHEFVLVFARSQPTYNAQMIETGIPISRASTSGRTHGENYGTRKTLDGMPRAGATDRFPRSVISIPSLGNKHPDRVHAQQKPDALMRRLILTYSNRGDLVVDPCAGSGTTGRAAIAEGRRAICWDQSPRFGRGRKIDARQMIRPA